MPKPFRLLALASLVLTLAAPAQPAPAQKVIFDTDIGDDIDDAYALALLLQSPEVKVIGITTAFGDTQLRARLVSRLLKDTGNAGIPVFAGPKTTPRTAFTQSTWALGSPVRQYGDAIAFLEQTISSNPGEITLVAVAPFTNLGALLRKDPSAIRKLRRVVLMGGSVRRGYGSHDRPDPEWNILCDIPAAKALFLSGVPLFVMPLDSTEIPLDEARQRQIFARGTPLTNDLQELTGQWTASTRQATPTLFDVVAAAYAVNPELCPTTPLHIEVDDKGFTRELPGAPNANVCLSSDPAVFFAFYLPRIMR